jgi:hypothetical protein
LAYLGAFLLAGFLLRGSSPRFRLGAPIALTLIGRALFHTWWEAENFEGVILPIVLVVAFSAGLARGEPATRLMWRRFGVGILLSLVAWLIVAHWPDTWKLRERTFMRGVEEAANVDRTKWRFLAVSGHAHEALELLNVPHGTLNEGPKVLDDINEELKAFPQQTTIIFDRRILDGMPFTIRNIVPTPIDTIEVLPCWHRLYQGDVVYGVRWIPPDSSSRPESPR